jgi:hypothetical protein
MAIIHKFVKSLSNPEKGELLKAIADTCYTEKGKVLDYLYDLAGFIAQEPEKKEIKRVIQRRPFDGSRDSIYEEAERADSPVVQSIRYCGLDYGITQYELDAVRAGNKIPAIKSLRARFAGERNGLGGLGLREAKEIIDDLTRRRNMPAPANPIPAVNLGGLNVEAEEVVYGLGFDQELVLTAADIEIVRDKHRVEAIKALMYRYGLRYSLKQLSDAFLKWQNGI